MYKYVGKLGGKGGGAVLDVSLFICHDDMVVCNKLLYIVTLVKSNAEVHNFN